MVTADVVDPGSVVCWQHWMVQRQYTTSILWCVAISLQAPATQSACVCCCGSYRATQQHEFSVFWVPRRSIACERLLEEEGVYGDLVQGEFPFDLVPLDDDVLSLELDNAFRECTLEGDPSSLFYAASAIMKLQQMYGLIPHIQVRVWYGSHAVDMSGCLLLRPLLTSAHAYTSARHLTDSVCLREGTWQHCP